MKLVKRYFNPGVIIFVVFLSVSYVLLFSYSTSPLYPYCYGGDSGGDSAHFMTVGKAWAAGRLPYRDMFDHKGPLIYFIDMVGFLLLGSKYGIAILQIIFMFFTFSSIWCISQLAHDSKTFGISVLVLSGIAMKVNYILGNTVEEYCLPFLGWAFFLLFRFFQKPEHTHDWRWTVFYGVTAGVCLLTRATNVIPIVGGILTVCVMLIVGREFANLGQNAVAFVGGFVLTILPFTLYFLANGSIGYAIYDIILFNVEYSRGVLPWFKDTGADTVIIFLKSFFLFYCIFFAGLIYFSKRNWIMGTTCIVTGLLEAVVFMNNQAWSQYALVCLPQIAVLMCAVRSAIEDEDSSIRFVGIMFVCAIVMFTNMAFCERVITAKDAHRAYASEGKRDWSTLVKRIPAEERDSFVAYGENDVKDLYLITDTIPCYKYYMIQDFVSRFSKTLQEDIKMTFDEGNAKWLLVDKESHTLDDLLQRRYSLFDENERYGLYKLKE